MCIASILRKSRRAKKVHCRIDNGFCYRSVSSRTAHNNRTRANSRASFLGFHFALAGLLFILTALQSEKEGGKSVAPRDMHTLVGEKNRVHGRTLEKPGTPDLSKEDHRLSKPHIAGVAGLSSLAIFFRGKGGEKSSGLCQDVVAQYQLVPFSSVLTASSPWQQR